MTARWIDPAAVPDLLKPGMRAYVGGSSNEPGGLLDAIAARPECAAGVTFTQFPLAGLNNRDLSALHPGRATRVLLHGAAARRRPRAGAGGVLADADARGVRLRGVATVRRRDAANGVRSRRQPASRAERRLRRGRDVERADADRRGQRSDRRTGRLSARGRDRFDALVRTHRPLAPFGGGVPDGTAHRIAEHVAALVRDGDCIQTGIGAIPAAILAALANKNDLGMHSGLIDDGGMDLIERGVMTGAAKPIDRGVHVTGMALGIRGIARLVGDSCRRVVPRCRSHARSRRDPADSEFRFDQLRGGGGSVGSGERGERCRKADLGHRRFGRLHARREGVARRTIHRRA